MLVTLPPAVLHCWGKHTWYECPCKGAVSGQSAARAARHHEKESVALPIALPPQRHLDGPPERKERQSALHQVPLSAKPLNTGHCNSEPPTLAPLLALITQARLVPAGYDLDVKIALPTLLWPFHPNTLSSHPSSPTPCYRTCCSPALSS